MNTVHQLPNQEKWIKLTEDEVKHIFLYYILLFVGSLIALFICFFVYMPKQECDLHDLLIISVVCGLLGSTIYYIRKLYKSCIQLLVDTSASDAIAAMGAKAYFYFRPFIGATLAIFVTMGVYGGFFFLQEKPEINSQRFMIFVALVSFVVGFANGSLIIRLDKGKEKIADMVKLGKEE